MKTFTLNDEQSKKANKWIKKHKCNCTILGGRISYIFTPIGIGDCIEVKCLCGKKKDLTEIKNW